MTKLMARFLFHIMAGMGMDIKGSFVWFGSEYDSLFKIRVPKAIYDEMSNLFWAKVIACRPENLQVTLLEEGGE